MGLLLVEDEAALACRIRESLEEARCTVDWARDGLEALARKQGTIVVDRPLPGTGGQEVCQMLRRRDPSSWGNEAV